MNFINKDKSSEDVPLPWWKRKEKKEKGKSEKEISFTEADYFRAIGNSFTRAAFLKDMSQRRAVYKNPGLRTSRGCWKWRALSKVH